MQTRFAFVGFRHSHSAAILAAAHEHPDCTVVACCEEDAATRAALKAGGTVDITHDDFTDLLAEVECDVVVVADYYGRRGALTIQALRAGRHVLSDKPLCTTISEQAQIEDLVTTRRLCVGLQLDSRGAGSFIRLREIIRAGELGEIHTVQIGGQHPLLLGTRPGWYFEAGKHGGAINDIGIHVFDLIPWLTGLVWDEVVAARSWNAKATAAPHFQDCAQFMAVLSNGAGVQADLSYLAPDKIGYQLPQYWRVLVHGSNGFAETHLLATHVKVALDHFDSIEERPAAESLARRYFNDFVNEVRGQPEACDLRTSDCLQASRLAVETQRRATE